MTGSLTAAVTPTMTAAMTSPAMTPSISGVAPSMTGTGSMSAPNTPPASVLPGASQSATNVVVGTAFLPVSNTPTGVPMAPSPKASPPPGKRPATKPQNLRVTKKSTNSLTVAWDDASNKAWQVSYKINTGGVWINLSATQKTFTINGLYPGSNYQIRVAGVSNTGKRGPFGPIIKGRTNPANVKTGIINIQGKWNRNDKQLHIKWKNGPTPFTSINVNINCAGSSVSFTINAGTTPNYPVRNIPIGVASCSLSVAPQYAQGSGPVYTQSFSTI